MTLQLIVFIVLALFIAVCSVLAVTTSRILRAATYLLFVLFGTAGIYFQLNYSFLGAVQLLIYAGGITVLYVFSILLTSSQGDKSERLKNGKMVAGVVSTLAGLGICLFVMLKKQHRTYTAAETAAKIRLSGFLRTDRKIIESAPARENAQRRFGLPA